MASLLDDIKARLKAGRASASLHPPVLNIQVGGGGPESKKSIWFIVKVVLICVVVVGLGMTVYLLYVKNNEKIQHNPNQPCVEKDIIEFEEEDSRSVERARSRIENSPVATDPNFTLLVDLYTNKEM